MMRPVALCRQRCELLSMNQQWSEAEDMCGSVIESDKELDVDWFDGGLGWTYFYRGQALEKQGKLVPALKDYNECIEAWAYLPDVTNVNVNEASWTQRQLRTAHFQRGDLACAGFCGGEQIGAMRSQLGATADFEAAVVSRHRLTAATPWHRSHCALLAQADYSYVINSPMTMAGTTNHAVTSARRGMAYLKLEENEHAFADFNAAVESPDGQTEAGWTLNRGLANARLDKWKEALADYTKAIELSPANSMAYSNRGIIYQRRRMWTTAIEDFASAEKAASDQHGKGDAMVHRAFCLLKLGKKEEALEIIGKACSTHKMSYACKYDGEDEIESLDMNTEVGELPNEVEALEGTGEAEDETWIPATALRAKSFEKGEEAKVVGLKQLKEAWEAYDEWSEDYAWQAGQSAFILDLDEEDGTVLLKFTEEAPEVKETEVAVTFQNAPIKHIKAKTLKPFKKRFAKTLVMFYRAASLCGHCPAIKPKFALVADYVMQRTGGKDFSVGAVDCSQKGAPEALCDGIWATHPGVDGSAPGSRSAPRVILFDGEWGEKGERGTPYNDPVNLGEHPGNMRAWLEEQGVAAASATAEVTKDEV